MPLYLYPTAFNARWKINPVPAPRRMTQQLREKARMSTKDDYVVTMKAQLDVWSAEIDALEAKAQEIKEDARVSYEAQLSALRVKYQEGEQKLEEMRLASETAWEQVKVEADKLWEAIKDSAHAFQSHYKA